MKVPFVLAGALALACGAASADTSLWAALVSDPVTAEARWVVDATEAGCQAQVAQARDFDVLEPCHATTPEAITDPKEDKRTSKTPRPKNPALF